MTQEKTGPILFEQGQEPETIRSNPTVIKVVGVGGGGCNALNRMIDAGIPDVEFIAVNTDMQSLNMSRAKTKIAIGRKSAQGRGSGADPERGREAAEEDHESIRAALDGANMVFIAAGMGKGTGTGASPIVARIARELGALCVAVVTRPFSWEGMQTARRAALGVSRLRDSVDSLIVIANDNIHRLGDRKMSVSKAWLLADSVLMNGVRGISHVITSTGQINVDFADVAKIMRESGNALLTMARAGGENKVSELLQQVTSNPLMESNKAELFTIDGARRCLVHITHGSEYSAWEDTQIRQGIMEKLHAEADIIPSFLEDPEMKDDVQIVLIATGFEEQARVDAGGVESDGTVMNPEAPETTTRVQATVVSEDLPTASLGNRKLKYLDERDYIVDEPSLLGEKSDGKASTPEKPRVQRLPAEDETLKNVAESDIPAYLRLKRS